jgi:hypothetical protein
MSYGFTVKSLNGRHVVIDVTGDIPDGEHRVTGHDGAAKVKARDAQGRWITEPDRVSEKNPDEDETSPKSK